MGLDMYLTADGNELGYWRKANSIHKWFVLNVQNGVDDCETYPVSEEKLKELQSLCESVVANSKLVPGQVECGQRSVAGGKWERLFEEGQVIEDPSFAIVHLPTTNGFFFGDTNYDQRYYQDLLDTIAICKKALDSNTSIEYHSSW